MGGDRVVESVINRPVSRWMDGRVDIIISTTTANSGQRVDDFPVPSLFV